MPNNQIRSHILEALLRLSPESAELQWTQAELHERQAFDLVAEGKTFEALNIFSRSLQEKEMLISKYPANHIWRLETGKSFAPPARLCESLDNYNEAALYFRRGIEVLQTLETEQDIDENLLDEIALTLQSFHAQMSSLELHKLLERYRNHDTH